MYILFLSKNMKEYPVLVRCTTSIPALHQLIKEIKESFNVYPVLIKEYERISCSCALHNFYPSITPTPGDLPFDYGVENAKKIYLF